MKRIDIPYHDILESISDGVFTIDLNWPITGPAISGSLKM